MSNILTDINHALNYDDIFIIPKYSEISSRKEVNISTVSNVINSVPVEVPVMPANMADIVNPDVAIATNKAGGLACLHRFSSIEDSVRDFLEAKNSGRVFVSIGVNRDYQERFQELKKVGANYFIIDIAHGHSLLMKNTIKWIKENYPDTYIMAGNITTPAAVQDLIDWGANAIKVGLSNGSVCHTKNVTGVIMPMVTAIKSCSFKRNEIDLHNTINHGFLHKTILVADGGIREIGDICKAIGLGADIVMCGSMFAGCNETPSYKSGKYSGSASKEIQTLYRTDKEYIPTPEGTTIKVQPKGYIADVIENIAGGLRSAYSYCGARNTSEYRRNCEFGIRHNKT
jgi:IMP dehydrogenase